MNDRELLELAADAAGHIVNARMQAERDAMGAGGVGLWVDGVSTGWNPLTDDGHALRLAVSLNMGISIHDGHCTAVAQVGIFCEERDNDTAKAIRRAIVRAAAESGVMLQLPKSGEEK